VITEEDDSEVLAQKPNNVWCEYFNGWYWKQG